jgi:phosphoglycolate phosphatase-like HAD superfamily hydrolase
MTHRPPLTAILWDFDGTLVDTRARNMNVNRRIIEEITGRPWTEFEVMRSEDIYERAQRISTNWREFYREHFGLDEEETTRAGSRWTPYQLEDQTPTPVLEGIAEALGAFDGLPLGVVSQNCSANIADTLAGHGIGDRFRCIIGYREVADRQQKPAPDGLLLAIEQLTGLAPGSVLYVGDHSTDLKTADNANRVLAERGAPVRVLSVAALYGVDAPPEPWTERADFRATTPMEIVEIARQIGGG